MAPQIENTALKEFYTSIYNLQLDQAKQVAVEELTATEQEELAAGLEQGKIAVDIIEIEIDVNQFRQFIKELFTFISEERPVSAASLNILTQRLEEMSEEELERLLKFDLTTIQSLNQDTELSSETLLYFLGQGMRPFFLSYAQTVEQSVATADWEKNNCPVCGHSFSMARIDEAGKRYLLCSNCATDWQFPRLVCAHCYSDEQTKLQLLTVDSIALYQVQVCDSCKGYVKTLDERKGMISASDSQASDAATYQLDLIVEKEGYTSKPEQQQKKLIM